jgi:4-amino-4-deoxy-L-arabinose transferase-like glycosyltransferase
MNAVLFKLINQTLANPLFDRVLPVLSDKDYVVIPGIVALVLLLYFGGRRGRTCVLALGLAVLLANIGSEKVLKNLVHEKRPYAVLEGVHLHRNGEWTVYDPQWYDQDRRQSNSFPSSHAVNAAAIAVVLAFLNRRTLWITAPLTVLVGVSRVYTGNHFPGDVLGGYLWGSACGLTAATLCPWMVRKVWGEEVPRPAVPISEERKSFFWVLGLWTVVNFSFIYLSRFNLAGDEAQYWDWSRHLALGYYSKPPMIAYLIKILTNAGGHKEWAIRSGAVLFSSGTLAFVYALTLRVAKREQTALLAACAALAMPSIWAGSALMTIDAPLVFFWAVALYTFHRAVNGEAAMWWLTGLALGLGMMTKYTMLALAVSFAAYLVLVDRAPLRRSGPYLALMIMVLCLTGVVYWNAANGWVSIRHTYSIGAGGSKSFGKTLSHFIAYFAGQLGLVSPMLFGLIGWAMVALARRFRQNRDAAYLFLGFIVLFGFYAAVSLTRAPQANWPVCAYIAAAPGLAWVWNERSRGPVMRKLLAAAVVLGCVMGIATRSTDLIYMAAGPFTTSGKDPARMYLGGLSIDPDRDPTNKLIGGRELGAALSKYVGRAKAETPFIFSNRYQLTAWAAFYTKGHPRTYCMNPGDRRYNQYDLWSGWNTLVGRDGLFVTGGDETRARAYINGMVQAGAFERGEYLETVLVYRNKTLVRTFTISRLYRYSGLEWTPAAEKF